MPPRQWQDLSSTVSALATDGILVQQRLDAAVAQSRERFAALLVTTPESLRSLLLPLMPAGICVKEYRVSCALRITNAHSVKLALVAAPINVGYAALYGTTAAEQSSLTVEVLAVPVSPAL